MFTKDDFRKLDKTYFEVIRKTAYYLDLKSKNTGHSWSIYYYELDMSHYSLVVRHKHHDKDDYHMQLRCHPRTVKEAQDLIKQHDTWHLNGRKRRRAVKGNQL